MYRRANAVIRIAAAYVAIHGLVDIVVTGFWNLRQQADSRHDLT